MSRTSTLGRYQILERVGTGAMGIVYRAMDPVIGRQVALKTVQLDEAAVEGKGKCLTRGLCPEARVAGALSHPGIVAIHDVVEDTQRHRLGIAMEFVEGRSLRELVNGPDPLPLELALEVAVQIAEALDHAHRQGVVHRDVKPGNVLIAADGRVKLADFGIAHLIDTALSQDLRFLGTPNYLAPERIAGGEVDRRADLFALGVVLYQMVTRRMPWVGESVAEVTRNIVESPPIPAEAFVPDLLPSVLEILARALRKDPDERYQDAAEMASDLRRVLEAQAGLWGTRPVERVAGRVAMGWKEAAARLGRSLTAAPGALRWVAAAGLLLALLALGAIRRPAAEGPAAPEGPSPQVLSAAARGAIFQGIELLRRGASEQAAVRFAELEGLAPASRRAPLLRRAAERIAGLDAAVRRELAVRNRLDRAASELRKGRFAAADLLLREALEIDPGNAPALDLARRVQERRLAAAPVAEKARPPAVPVPTPLPAASPIVSLAVTPRPATAELRLDLFSERPQGVLTLYSGANQLFREAFRFYERRGPLPGVLGRRPSTGALERTLEVEAGEIVLRVYLALPEHPTQLVTLQGSLRGGAARVLRVRVSESGVLQVRLI